MKAALNLIREERKELVALMSQQQQRLTQIDMAIELLNGGAVHVLGPKKATVTKRNLLKTGCWVH